MIEIKGTSTEIAEAVRGISDSYPVDLLLHLALGEWHFTLNGVDVLAIIEEEQDGGELN